MIFMWRTFSLIFASFRRFCRCLFPVVATDVLVVVVVVVAATDVLVVVAVFEPKRSDKIYMRH